MTNATQTVQQIAPKAALQMIDVALAHARANNWEVAAAVYDPGGNLVAFGRTEKVAIPSVQFAMDKGWTSAGLRRSTKAFGERMLERPDLSLGMSNRDRIMAWGGGVAIFDGDVCVGGIGVSGARDFEDIECCDAAIAAVGLTGS